MPFTFVPGQFLNVAFSIGGARMNRSYSISSSPTEREYVDLTIKREPRGAVSRHIVDLLKVGDLIEAGGPVGKFTFDGAQAESIVLIAAGVGITPMLSITRYLTERSWSGEIFFIYTCRTPADFIFADEVAALQKRNPKLHVAVTSTKAEGTDWKGPRGRLTKELLTQTVPDLASRRIHICGPPTMMEATKAILTELGVSPDQVKSELFGATKPSPAVELFQRAFKSLNKKDFGRAMGLLDQLIAKKIGQETTLPSLQISSETTTQQAAGNGIATAATVSFRDANTPLPMEYNPKKVFNTLFGTTTPKERVLNARESDSLLDLISRELLLRERCGETPRLDEYLTRFPDFAESLRRLAKTETDPALRAWLRRLATGERTTKAK
jgi:ferredoxin-NADP reductase